MMSPVEGVVAVGESKAVTCSVRPVDASVFVSQAALRVGQGVNAIKPKPLLEMKARSTRARTIAYSSGSGTSIKEATCSLSKSESLGFFAM